MRRGLKSSICRLCAVAVILTLAGSAFAVPRDGRDAARERKWEQGIIKAVKKMVRGLGDGLVVPLPKPNP
jgi:hypothetical protein